MVTYVFIYLILNNLTIFFWRKKSPAPRERDGTESFWIRVEQGA